MNLDTKLMITRYLQDTNRTVFSDDDLEITLDKITQVGKGIVVQFPHSDGHYVDTIDIDQLEFMTWVWLQTLGGK